MATYIILAQDITVANKPTSVIARGKSFKDAFSQIIGHAEPNSRMFSVQIIDETNTNFDITLPFTASSLKALQAEMQSFPDDADEMRNTYGSVLQEYQMKRMGLDKKNLTPINWLHVGIGTAVGVGIGIAIGISFKK